MVTKKISEQERTFFHLMKRCGLTIKSIFIEIITKVIISTLNLYLRNLKKYSCGFFNIPLNTSKYFSYFFTNSKLQLE